MAVVALRFPMLLLERTQLFERYGYAIKPIMLRRLILSANVPMS